MPPLFNGGSGHPGTNQGIDGHTVPVDIAANSKETIDESQMQMNIYDPDDKILQVNIPGVEKSAT